VERVVLGGRALFIKRDDVTSTTYGGNKVRKLERFLPAARDAGKERLVTIGAAGSHQVLATAIFGVAAGFAVEAVLVPQPATPHGETNLRVAIARGLRPVVASTWPSAPAVLATRIGRDAYVIPLGGSNALGSLGFVDAARELAAQIEAGLLPEPDAVVVAMGSGGTAAGLAVGFEGLGLRTRVVGVAISAPMSVLGMMARHVARRTAERVGLSRGAAVRAAARIEVDRRWLGRGYGYSTPDVDAAMREAARLTRGEPLRLEPTYTGKAFAAALDRSRTSDRVLYWHTLSAVRPSADELPELPRELTALFR
jgi:1-aminocyclopropane-1-carboxylate deaminase/D-cysteine desulfhydrase-like pyridoxal-dependent ACC family enzyme